MHRFKRMDRVSYASVALVLLAFMAWSTAAGSRALECRSVTRTEIENLFVDWNNALMTGNPDNVVALYAPDAVLLPTVENGPLTDHTAIRGYFVEFLKDKPSGVINQRIIRIGCNVAFDVGLYTFTYNKQPPPPDKKDSTAARYTYVYEYDGGRWLITHHHSSKRPK